MVFPLGFPSGSEGKGESICNSGGLSSIPGIEKILEEGITAHSSILA